MTSPLDRLMELALEIQKVPIPGDAAWELTTLRAIKKWAIDRLPHKVGARVTTAPNYRPPDSYEPYAQPGSIGTIRKVQFNAHYDMWQYLVKFDGHDSQFSFSAAQLVETVDA